MHVYWAQCPIAWQGAMLNGKQPYPSFILEAACDYNLWIWSQSFGYAGGSNDLNVWDNSPLHEAMVSGEIERNMDFPFEIAGREFTKLWWTSDGIYPELERFVKTISVPLSRDEIRFSGWQESTRKDIERAFAVLQCRWQILASPLKWRETTQIYKLVVVCIMLHNMMVQDRLDGDDDDDLFLVNNYDRDYDLFQEEEDRELRQRDSALEEEEALEAEVERRLAVSNAYRQASIAHLDIVAAREAERINELPQNARLVERRWSSLYNKENHQRLQRAIVAHLQSLSTNNDN